MSDDLLARLQALLPEERASLLARLDDGAPGLPGQGASAPNGRVTGEVAGRPDGALDELLARLTALPAHERASLRSRLANDASGPPGEPAADPDARSVTIATGDIVGRDVKKIQVSAPPGDAAGPDAQTGGVAIGDVAGRDVKRIEVKAPVRGPVILEPKGPVHV
ncbi:MAG: hypothetical protein RMK84_13035 [Oscillochloridaceae bacterium]|nr:hypothetical protein [Chloroflexaceae bacterium]MDW8391045.1 hypothetical protein [Oscillochloridaceae bacterium]